MNAAVIVAAGSATRMGFDKLLAPLAGDAVILHTLRAFEACGDIHGMWVVSTEERGAVIRALATEAGISRLRAIVPGGAERQLSVWSGLQALPDDCELVAIHDGARPLIQPLQISRCLEKAKACGAAASARRVNETLKRADSDGRVTGGIERDGAWIMETPQIFRSELLKSAYTEVLRRGASVTDEVSAAELAGIPVWLVENPAPNPKITVPGDLGLAERLGGWR
jgi:2-C-methyl-D-erythritol 4-phosphate cytidylyltransferase